MREKIGYFSVIPPPPHQKIRKTVEIVPEKMKKSSIEILQILVLSKYNKNLAFTHLIGRPICCNIRQNFIKFVQVPMALTPHPFASFRMEMCMPGAKVFPSLTIKQSAFFFPSEWKCACHVQRFFFPLQLNNQPFSFFQN